MASGHDSFKEIRKLDGFNEILNAGVVNETKKLHHHKKRFCHFSIIVFVSCFRRNLSRGWMKFTGFLIKTRKTKFLSAGQTHSDSEAHLRKPWSITAPNESHFFNSYKSRKLFHYKRPGRNKFLCVFTISFHQVPNSLLIFRLFSAEVWISILITLITAAFAYAFLLTMIDDFEARCKCDGWWSTSFSNHFNDLWEFSSDLVGYMGQ